MAADNVPEIGVFAREMDGFDISNTAIVGRRIGLCMVDCKNGTLNNVSVGLSELPQPVAPKQPASSFVQAVLAGLTVNYATSFF